MFCFVPYSIAIAFALLGTGAYQQTEAEVLCFFISFGFLVIGSATFVLELGCRRARR